MVHDKANKRLGFATSSCGFQLVGQTDPVPIQQPTRPVPSNVCNPTFSCKAPVKGLSTGEIAGLVVAATILVAVLAFVCILTIPRRSKIQQGFDLLDESSDI